ncbi:MAG: T9SS type A sorting domain-containing protein, partial [Muribaculaceae bacterium]|nr:T9SS type A sorting domain-containing protein [Muribaculaceae bacterium]
LVYPNPTDGVLFVETHGRASLSNQTYRITNLMGQTLMTGAITSETQQIDVSNLPDGMYFIIFAGETRKFVVR